MCWIGWLGLPHVHVVSATLLDTCDTNYQQHNDEDTRRGNIQTLRHTEGIEIDGCLKRLEDLQDFSQGKLAIQQQQEEEEEQQQQRGQGHEIVVPNFYFFLHIPRCAGRTLHFCLLKSIFPPKDRCMASYKEHSRPDESPLEKLGHTCKLQGTHDDLSILGQLPDNTAVFTQIRNPVDRVLSAYEFAVEVAIRNYFSGTRSKNNPKNKDRTSTEEVWPWSNLVPILMEDFAARRKEREDEAIRVMIDKEDAWVRQYTPEGKDFFYYNRARNETRTSLDASNTGANNEDALLNVLEDLNPYDNPLVMPLRDFVKLPEVHHVVLNNEVFQILGVTNISTEFELARDIRMCSISATTASSKAKEEEKEKDGISAVLPSFQEALLMRAKAVVDRLWHVSVFDDLEGS